MDILARYQLAELIKNVHDDHTKNRFRRYGAHSVKKLATFFGWEASTIYAALRMAQAFTKAEIEALTLRRMSNGQPLCCYHVLLLSNIADQKTRHEMLEHTLSESWSTRDPAYHIHNLPLPKKEEETRGRPLALPRNFHEVIQQQDRSADDFLMRSEKVWSQQEHGLLAWVRDCSQDECTPERLEQFRVHAQKLRRLADEAVKRAEEAERAYEYVLSRLRKQKALRDGSVSAPSDNLGLPPKDLESLPLPD